VERPSQQRVSQLLAEALDGNARNIDELRAATREQLDIAGKALGGEPAVGRSSVLRILRDWRDGALSDEQVRWWGLLLFIGAFPAEWSPYGWRLGRSAHQPIAISYSDDEAVNEVVFELKDVGDFDDEGRIKRAVDDMIRTLSEP
jgi:hypothetical protein